MFLCGNQIVNDYNFDLLFHHLSSLKAVRGRDYLYYSDKKIILRPTTLILSSPLIYQYEVLSIGWPEKIIRRKIDIKQKKITDYVFSSRVRHGIKGDTFGPITAGWSYDFNFSSVINGTMALIETIPFLQRKDPLFVATYLCAHLDVFNNPKNGIIEGCWDKTLVGGTHPSLWQGSAEIFRQRLEKNKPVQYGQCWVLSDLLVGILKFIGIHSRSVRINRCIIDLYDVRGMDIIYENGLSTKQFPTDEKKKILNPCRFITEKKFVYSRMSLPANKTFKKGALFSFENDFKINHHDFYDLNSYSERKGQSWNFHVWTECYILGDWYVLDPSPLLDIGNDNNSLFLPYHEKKRWPIFDGLRFFGPIKVSDLHNNKEDSYQPATFRYLYSCVNGQLRYWTPFSSGGKNILYLFNVDYKSPYVIGKTKYGENIDMTDFYRKKENHYDCFHYSHPVFLRSKGNDLTKIYLYFSSFHQNKKKYIIQFCLLSGNHILYLHREASSLLTEETFKFLKDPSLQKYREAADRLTLTVYDLILKEFWSQCIKV